MGIQFLKDPMTGHVHNTDNNALNQFEMARKKSLQLKKLENDVENLKKGFTRLEQQINKLLEIIDKEINKEIS